MEFQPFIFGRGMSGQAIAKALSVVDIIDPAIDIRPPVYLKRNQSLAGLVDGAENPLLCVGNPHGLHARSVLEAGEAGLRDIILDKPVCVREDEMEPLARVSANVAVLHGFRLMWGPQRIKRMIDRGELGEIISIEGRYWQSSAAQVAVDRDPPADKVWKSDIELNGRYDTLVDLGTHWCDLMLFLAGGKPKSSRIWLSYVNAIAPHRDTHGHVYLEFPDFRSLGSISKTCHGAGNDLEFTVLGKERSASWCVQQPDQIRICRGSEVTTSCRRSGLFGSRQPPFHGLGWLEGYTEIIHAFLRRKAGRTAPDVPTLEDGLRVMDVIFHAEKL